MTGSSNLSRGVCIATALAVLVVMVLPLGQDLATTFGRSNRRSAPPVRARPHLVKAVRMEEKVPRPAKLMFRFRFTLSERRFPTSPHFPERELATPRLMSAIPPLRC
jgi:hypothetical protein